MRLERIRKVIKKGLAVAVSAVLLATSANSTALAAQATDVTTAVSETTETTTETVTGEESSEEAVTTQTTTEEKASVQPTSEETTDAIQTEKNSAIADLQDRINALPTIDEFRALADGTTVADSTLNQKQYDIYMEAQAICDAYEALSEEEQSQIDITKLQSLLEGFTEETEELASVGSYEQIEIASSSLNGNAIWGATESYSGVAMDSWGHFYSASRYSTGGLPVNGKVTTSSGVPYYLAAGEDTSKAYDGNDCIRLTSSTQSVTMNLQTIGVYNNVYVLATAGGPGEGNYADFKVTLKYTDGTTGSTEYRLYDWYDNTTVSGVEKYRGIMRMKNNTTTVDTSNTSKGPILHSAAISVNKGKLLKSITFTMNGKNGNSGNMSGLYCCVFAVTGATPSGTPAKPVATAATKTEGDTTGAFTAHWNTVSGATGYCLDVATDRKFTNIVSGYNNLNVGNTLEYKVNSNIIKTNTTYYYRVRAVNAQGQSLSSNIIATDLPIWVKNALKEEDYNKVSYDADTNTIRFNEDVELKDTLKVPANETTTINVNQNTVKAPDGKSAISSAGGSDIDLTIKGTDGTGKIIAGANTAGNNGIPAIDFGNATGNSSLTITGSKVIGGDGTTGSDGTAGSGGAGVVAGSGVQVGVGSQGEVIGGNGGNATTGAAGNGGAGISGGSVSVSTNGCVNGGNGGDSSTGKAGNGGAGISGGSVSVSTNGSVNGGNGGDSSDGTAGNGGAGISGGSVTTNGGTVGGGNGGNGNTPGTGGSAGTNLGTVKTGQTGKTHIHQWKYILSGDGKTITASCIYEKGDCEYKDRTDITCSIGTTNITYSGNAYDGASVENNITSVTGAEASLKYYLSGGTTLTTASNSGATEDGGVPKDAGKYTAKVTIGEVTAISDFEIKKVNLTPTVSLTDWVYGEPASSPVVEGNTMNGRVTYYYKKKGADDSTYVAIDSDLDFSKIPAGQYTLKACIEETTNYNAAEATCDFAVTKNSITVNVTMDAWTYGEKAKTPLVTVKADDKDITSSYEESQITYTYYTDVDCTNKTTSANGAVSDGAVPKNAGTYYVKADVAETDNYVAGSDKTAFTIAKKNVTAKVTVKNKTYDGTLSADVAAAVSSSDLVDGDQLDITGITGTFADKNAGDDKQVTVNGSDPTITGSGADNYNVTIDESETITATINKRVVELKWDSNPAYTGNEQSMTATVSNAIDGDSFDLKYTGNTGTNVGDTYTAKVTDLGNENYTLEGSKTVEQKWSISYLETEATADIAQAPDGTNGWYKQDVIVKAPQGYQISEDGKTWKDSLSYTEDGTYTKNYYLKDAKGHITDKKVLNFKIDKTAPTGTVKIKEKVFDKPLNQITYGCFFKDNAEITIEGADVTSDIAKIEYQKVPKGDTFDENGTWTEGKTLSIAANDKAVIYVRLTDKAGNQSIINTDGIVVYTDATATSKETFAKGSTADVTTGITVNGNTIASVMVKNADDESEPTQIDASNYEIKNDKLVLKASYLQTLAAGGYTLTVNYNPYGETYVEGDKPNTSVITFTINRSKGSMTDISDISKVYDGTPVGTPTFTTTNDRGTADANVTVEYKKQDADDSTYTKDAPKNYGEYVVRITVKADGNYESVSATKEFSIAKKEMQVSAEGYTGTYDGQVHGIAVKVIDPADSAASNAKVVYGTKGADGNITYSETPVTYKDAGAYTVYYKVTADNYVDAIGSAVIEIVPKTVSLVWSDTEFTYDGKAHKPSAKVSDVDIIGSDSVDVTVAGEQKNAGEYTAKAAVSGNNNYILGADADTVFVIKKAAATVTVDNATKHIGKDDPKFTYKVTGLVEGESLTDITVARTEGETAGSYDITATVKDGSNANYDVTFVAGKLTIEDHTAVVDKAVAATCTETGLTEGSHCSVCNEVLVAQTVVDAFGHDWSEWVKTGNREKSTCSRCGQVKYRNIETADTGSLEKDAEVAPGAPITAATLDNNKLELIAADGIFTEEERADIESGAVARVWIEISATSNLADADKQKVEAEAKKIMGSDISKVVYFDADLFKSVTKDGTTTKAQITEPGTEIEVSVSLPESLVQADSTISRAYKIIRLHNGKVDSFDAAFDKETGTLTFKTDRFSTYAIAFTDTQLVTGITLTPDSKTLTKKGETLQLTATVTPDNAANKNVTWTSSDSKVATVDENGLVTAVANGTAIITVTTEDGGKTTTAEITVNISSEDDNNSDKDKGSSDGKPATITTDNKNNTGTAKTDNHSDATHQTGDTTNLAFWIILFMASFAGLIGLLVKRKKENGK